MKRTLAFALLGMAAATSSFGQGHLFITTYVSPYAASQQIVWGAGSGLGGPVQAGQGLQLQVFFAEGVVADQALLTPGELLSIDATKGYNGGGWTTLATQVLPTWAPGETFTFQLRVIGGSSPNGPVDLLSSRSGLWTESAAIVTTAFPPELNQNPLGLTVVVPEPSTFALAGLGAAALLIFRRRA